jgi:Fe-S-cluster containining protein
LSDSYRDLLDSADRHFAAVASAQPESINCRRGCTFCCHGLFEITGADVSALADGLARLAEEKRSAIVERARAIVDSYEHPNLRECTPAEKEDFFSRTDSVACPNLQDDGGCAVYESRPLVCRTFGLTIRDGERFLGEECELNFTSASEEKREEAAWDLQWEDVVGSDDEFTVPEAILLAERLRS